MDMGRGIHLTNGFSLKIRIRNENRKTSSKAHDKKIEYVIRKTRNPKARGEKITIFFGNGNYVGLLEIPSGTVFLAPKIITRYKKETFSAKIS